MDLLRATLVLSSAELQRNLRKEDFARLLVTRSGHLVLPEQLHYNGYLPLSLHTLALLMYKEEIPRWLEAEAAAEGAAAAAEGTATAVAAEASIQF